MTATVTPTLTVTPTPFIRCAGGKRRLASEILSRCPPTNAYHTYVEPFVGGAAVYYALWADGRLEGKQTLLADVDDDLVKLYQAVQTRPDALIRSYDRRVSAITSLEDAESVYLTERQAWNRGLRTPSRHYYLRQNAYNGLWRCNSSGELNTPFRHELPRRADRDVIMAASQALQDALLHTFDFEQVVVSSGSFVYLDPPYLTKGFKNYTSAGWSEQRLAALLTRAARWRREGSYVLLSHADTTQTRELVAQHWPEARVETVYCRRNINCRGDRRHEVPELLVFAP